MADHDEIVSLTSDDEQARRLCALAVAFSNAKSPIPSTDIHASYYPDLSYDSFRRKYSRDREKLVECGLVIRSVVTDDNEVSWQADVASFADGSALSPEDALMLDVLCAQLVDDPSFAQRYELRLALAKIDHAFGSLSAARIDPQPRSDAGTLQTMLACMSSGTPARITYVDAKGNQTERIVAPYGHFGLRGNVYFVCARMEGGVANEKELRTFRASRIQKATKASGSFTIPEDFNADDHSLLPFQMGPAVCEATLLVPADADKDMLAELDRHARRQSDEQKVYVSDVLDAARWCVAAGMVPTAPDELVDAWHATLDAAAQLSPSPMPAVEAGAQKDSPRGRRGRPGASSAMRELVALVSSLGHEGATLTPAAVSARLGIPPQRARLLINLVLTACTDTGYQLPLGLSGDDGVVLSRSQGVTGRPIRLTRSEADALVAALDELGFSADDPLREDVLLAFAPSGLTVQQAQKRVDDALSRQDNETLEACSRTIMAGGTLTFLYSGINQSAPRKRHVRPQELRRTDDLWYLDAYDFDRGALRTFRIDRMADIRVAPPQDGDADNSPAIRNERQVDVAFLDKSMLDLFEWPRLEIVGQSAGAIVATLPYYGGPWLPRHLAACADVAVVSDEELVAAVRVVAEDMR